MNFTVFKNDFPNLDLIILVKDKGIGSCFP